MAPGVARRLAGASAPILGRGEIVESSDVGVWSKSWRQGLLGGGRWAHGPRQVLTALPMERGRTIQVSPTPYALIGSPPGGIDP